MYSIDFIYLKAIDIILGLNIIHIILTGFHETHSEVSNVGVSKSDQNAD